jgi:PadR family transcriptional regulator PadR
MNKQKKGLLQDLDYYVLSELSGLGPESYGVPIHEAVEEAVEHFVSIGAIYAALGRLERNGFVSSRMGEATPERGGRAKKFFKIEGAGMQALSEAERIREKLVRRLRLQPAGGNA